MIKVIVRFLTNSQVILADAFNSASDVFSSVMTFIGNRIASLLSLQIATNPQS